MLNPLFDELSEVGTELPVAGWMTVVVVEWEVLPLAITSAITPPATAPPMTGMMRPMDLMFGYS
jgi:hypothetical protein